MSQIAYMQYLLSCEVDDLDVYFEYNNSIIFTTEKENISNDGLKSKKCSELTIITQCNIEQYNSPFEVSRFCRGDILTLQGIISFLRVFRLQFLTIAKPRLTLSLFNTRYRTSI